MYDIIRNTRLSEYVLDAGLGQHMNVLTSEVSTGVLAIKQQYVNIFI